jgi:hypothetical protein
MVFKINIAVLYFALSVSLTSAAESSLHVSAVLPVFLIYIRYLLSADNHLLCFFTHYSHVI